MNEVPKLVTTKPDAEIAAEFRKELVTAATPLVDIIQRAKDAGFNANFQIGPGPLGRIALLNVTLMKEF